MGRKKRRTLFEISDEKHRKNELPYFLENYVIPITMTLVTAFSIIQLSTTALRFFRILP